MSACRPSSTRHTDDMDIDSPPHKKLPLAGTKRSYLHTQELNLPTPLPPPITRRSKLTSQRQHSNNSFPTAFFRPPPPPPPSSSNKLREHELDRKRGLSEGQPQKQPRLNRSAQQPAKAFQFTDPFSINFNFTQSASSFTTSKGPEVFSAVETRLLQNLHSSQQQDTGKEIQQRTAFCEIPNETKHRSQNTKNINQSKVCRPTTELTSTRRVPQTKKPAFPSKPTYHASVFSSNVSIPSSTPNEKALAKNLPTPCSEKVLGIAKRKSNVSPLKAPFRAPATVLPTPTQNYSFASDCSTLVASRCSLSSTGATPRLSVSCTKPIKPADVSSTKKLDTVVKPFSAIKSISEVAINPLEVKLLTMEKASRFPHPPQGSLMNSQKLIDGKENIPKLRQPKGTAKAPMVAAPARRKPSELATARMSEVGPEFHVVGLCKDAIFTDVRWNEYALDIYECLKKLEQKRRPRLTYMAKQSELNVSMRMILVDWIVTVTEDFRLSSETACLTVNYIDRFLSFKRVSRANLQLVGVTSIFLASKCEETQPCTLQELVSACAGAYTSKQIMNMEKIILKALSYELEVATCWGFCAFYWRAMGLDAVSGGEKGVHAIQMDNDGVNVWVAKARELSHFLMDLSLTEYALLKYLPSEIAISSIVVSLHTLHVHNRLPPLPQFTSQCLNQISGYDVSRDPRVRSCVDAMSELNRKAIEEMRTGSKTREGVRAKYEALLR